MPHPIVHAEIRSTDPDATRKFFADLLGWTYPDPGAVPGYTFVDTGVPGALYTAISPLQGGSDLVTLLHRGGRYRWRRETGRRTRRPGVQEPQHVPGVAFALIADPQGHVVGLTPAGLSVGGLCGQRRLPTACCPQRPPSRGPPKFTVRQTQGKRIHSSRIADLPDDDWRPV